MSPSANVNQIIIHAIVFGFFFPDCEFSFLPSRRLLEKSQRIEAILASLQASGAEPEQLTEVEEMITAAEKQQLETLRLHINK